MSFTEKISELLYQSDVIAIRKGSLDIDFLRTFHNPAWILQLADAAAQVLDDYAIDGLIARPDSLAFLPHAAVQLELPMALWRGESVLGGFADDVQRVMICTLLTPSEDEVLSAEALCAAKGIELVGFFSFLGLGQRENSSVRLISMIELRQVLEEYRRLFLVTNDEYERLSQLDMNQPEAASVS